MDIEKKRDIKTIAITWAPNNTFHTNDPKIGFSMAVQILKKIRTVSKEFTLYPELGVSGSNIHFHGVIKLHDEIKWYKSVLPILKRNGFIKIKAKYNDGWLEYCTKDWEVFKNVLDLDRPIDDVYINKIVRVKREKGEIPQQNIVDMIYGISLELGPGLKTQINI